MWLAQIGSHAHTHVKEAELWDLLFPLGLCSNSRHKELFFFFPRSMMLSSWGRYRHRYWCRSFLCKLYSARFLDKILLGKGQKEWSQTIDLVTMFPSHSIWVSIKMLESNIRLFFKRASGWQELFWIDVDMQAVELSLSRHHWDLHGRAVPINNNDLIFFSQILQIAVSSDLTSSLIAKKALNTTKERQEGASVRMNSFPAMPAPPWDRAGWPGRQ